MHVDVLVLGAGTAGLNARRAAEKAGATVVMADPGPYGTTCARVGCMPSKLLIAAADAAHHAAHASPFGVDTTVKIDGRRVMERVQRERDRFVGFVNESIDGHLSEGRLLPGRGVLIDPNTAEVNGQRVSFDALVVATGSSPFVPPPFRGLEDITVDSGGLFDLEDLPDSVLVVGTGVIGLELGQALHRLGVRTTLVGRGGRLGPISDGVVLASMHAVLGEELDLAADYVLDSVEHVPEGVRVRFDGRDETYSRILMAAGRRPNRIEGLPEGAFDGDTAQLGDSNVFLAGDVSAYRPLLHEAADEGKIAGANAARFPEVFASARRVPLGIVFTDPQIALVGTRHADLEEDVHRIGEVDYGRQGRARVMNRHAGVVRIYGSRHCGKLVGAEMFGPNVEHTAHLLAWAIQQDLSVDQALEMPFYHPVLEEGIRTALQDLRHQLRIAGVDPCADTIALE